MTNPQHNLDRFVAGLRDYSHGQPDVTDIRGQHQYAIDFELRVAPNEPFNSSVVLGAQRNEVRTPALRFRDGLREEYSLTYLRQTFERLVAESDPPGTGWSSYPMGDVGGGPHVVNDMTPVDATKFVRFVQVLVENYEWEFDEKRGEWVWTEE